MFPADDVTFMTQAALQPITGLIGHMLFMQAETTDTSDWLQYNVANENYIIRREHQSSSGAGTAAGSQVSYVSFFNRSFLFQNNGQRL